MNSQLLENPFHYKFPRIEHIDDVLPYIKDCDEIIVAERGLYKVINYVGMSGDLFRPPVKHEWAKTVKPPADWKVEWELSHESAIRRECRGMIFDRSGKIVRRPYHKFFNLNEREETLEKHVTLDQDHCIMQKLDGSKISCFMLDDGNVRFGTKMGETPICEPVKEFFTRASPWTRFARAQIEEGYTPIFEWCTPENQIVIYYDRPQLIATASRHMITGEYLDYEDLHRVSWAFNVPVVKRYEWDAAGSFYVACAVKEMVDDEGVVIAFDDGMRVKVKSDWYVAIHKMKDHILYERNVIPLILEEKMDDVLPHITDQDKKRMEEYVASFLPVFTNQYTALTDIAKLLVLSGESKKQFAVRTKDGQLGPLRSVMFRFMDENRDPQTGQYPTMDIKRYMRDQLKELWLRQCISNSKLAEFKNQTRANTGWR